MATPLPVQNWIDFDINPLTREVTLGTDFGDMPAHLKRGDQRELRVRFRASKDADGQQLAGLDYLRFGCKEKGRYDDGPYMAYGEVGADAWDDDLKCYKIEITLDAAALLQLLSQALDVDFDDGSYDAFAALFAASAVTTVTTTGTAGDTTQTTDDDADDDGDMPLLDKEFMAEFEWSQGGHVESTQTFALDIARDVISDTAAAGGSIPQPTNQPTDWRFLVPMVDGGTPFNGSFFGYFRATKDVEVLGLQIALKQPDPTHGFRVQLTDATGQALDATKYFGDMPAAQGFAYLPFGQVLTLAAAAEVRATILNYAGNLSDDSVTAAGLTVNLVCRQYAANQPAGPSGPPGVTAVQANTLAPGTAATAQLQGQTLLIGIPQGAPGDRGPAGVSTVQVTTLAPNAPATAVLDGTTLKLGIPQGKAGQDATGGGGASGGSTTDPGDGVGGDGGNVYPGAKPIVTAEAYENNVQYAAGASVVLQLTYKGRGRPATIHARVQNSDSVAKNQDLFHMEVRRSDKTDPIETGDYLMMPGHVMNFHLPVDDVTSTDEVTYSLIVSAFDLTSSYNAPGNLAPRAGLAQIVRLKLTEF